jgi:D-alanyl-D-alanine carboxypeptidase
MSTSAHPWAHPASRRGVLWLIAALLLVAGFVVYRGFYAGGVDDTSRPELQRVLDGLVSEKGGVAPGVTAYVSGPHGTWAGAAGVANVSTGEAMQPDDRMRIASISKWYAAALVLHLAQEGRLRLDDSVERWLPGLLPYGSRITLPQLMTDTSGLIDDNVTPAALATMLARVKDARLRTQLQAIAMRIMRNPSAEVSTLWPIRLAASQPLLSAPGTSYHHSNIGWNILGLVAQKAGGKPIETLYRTRIFEPLRLGSTAFDPQGPIAGPHAHGYSIAPNGTTRDTTSEEPAKFVDGGIVSNAEDVATFFTALMRGRLVDVERLASLDGLGLVDGGGTKTDCAGRAHVGDGASAAYKTNVLVAPDGSRVAVVLLNGDTLGRNGRIDLETSDGAASAAVLRLFCSA